MIDQTNPNNLTASSLALPEFMMSKMVLLCLACLLGSTFFQLSVSMRMCLLPASSLVGDP